MKRSSLKRLALYFFIAFYSLSFSQNKKVELLDYDIQRKSDVKNNTDPTNYTVGISGWSTIKDVHKWIKDNFEYDLDRAMLLANNKKSNSNTAIHTPNEFWTIKKGTCIDLSRFAYETTKLINNSIKINYLKIQFEPLNYNGSKFIYHWLISVEKEDQFFFFADSKRPHIIDGPYASVRDFINAYEKFRQRKIVSYKLLDSYQKSQKKKIMKRKQL